MPVNVLCLYQDPLLLVYNITRNLRVFPSIEYIRFGLHILCSLVMAVNK